jgi:hypothetical protein
MGVRGTGGIEQAKAGHWERGAGKILAVVCAVWCGRHQADQVFSATAKFFAALIEDHFANRNSLL